MIFLEYKKLEITESEAPGADLRDPKNRVYSDADDFRFD